MHSSSDLSRLWSALSLALDKIVRNQEKIATLFLVPLFYFVLLRFVVFLSLLFQSFIRFSLLQTHPISTASLLQSTQFQQVTVKGLWQFKHTWQTPNFYLPWCMQGMPTTPVAIFLHFSKLLLPPNFVIIYHGGFLQTSQFWQPSRTRLTLLMITESFIFNKVITWLNTLILKWWGF